MFCSSLRKRPEWASVPNTLLSSKQIKWREKDLVAHDLAIPILQLREEDPRELFHLILLSPMDLQPNGDAMARIERLYHQNGGSRVGIVFLLREKTPNSDGTFDFMKLQASLLPTLEMPVMPLSTLSSLQQTLFNFQRQLVPTRKEAAIPRISPAMSLLPYCSSNPPIPEHQKNILSEICHSIPVLARAATTHDGQRAIRENLPDAPKVAEDIIGFWQEECFVD